MDKKEETSEILATWSNIKLPENYQKNPIIVKWLGIVSIKRAIMLRIIRNERISSSSDNLHIDDY